mmetsp:Transcript_23182/g.64372  ORF Transcript_23182/g.64372 Transcript_23182/m.64372 type:complete len:252 (-) Transcript_23182:509-1264(-)
MATFSRCSQPPSPLALCNHWSSSSSLRNRDSAGGMFHVSCGRDASSSPQSMVDFACRRCKRPSRSIPASRFTSRSSIGIPSCPDALSSSATISASGWSIAAWKAASASSATLTSAALSASPIAQRLLPCTRLPLPFPPRDASLPAAPDSHPCILSSPSSSVLSSSEEDGSLSCSAEETVPTAALSTDSEAAASSSLSARTSAMRWVIGAPGFSSLSRFKTISEDDTNCSASGARLSSDLRCALMAGMSDMF